MKEDPWIKAEDGFPIENVFVLTYRGGEDGYSIERGHNFKGNFE